MPQNTCLFELVMDSRDVARRASIDDRFNRVRGSAYRQSVAGPVLGGEHSLVLITEAPNDDDRQHAEESNAQHFLSSAAEMWILVAIRPPNSST